VACEHGLQRAVDLKANAPAKAAAMLYFHSTVSLAFKVLCHSRRRLTGRSCLRPATCCSLRPQPRFTLSGPWRTGKTPII
jgi:hypothetical protein